MRITSTSCLVGLCLSLSLSSLSAQTGVTTLYAGGNSLNSPGSVMFDATVLNPDGLVVTSFDINCENTRNGPIGSVFQIDIYITALGGTYVGNEGNPAVWTKVAEGTGVSGAISTPTPVDTSDFFLPQGRFGMAINFVIPTGALGTAFAYTNGTGLNQSYADANLQLDLGSSGSGIFSPTVYTPRVFNGTVYYEAGTNAAYGPYGTGCDGGAPQGVPVLRPSVANPRPVLGAIWEQDLTNLSATPGLGIMVFGLSTQTWGPWQLPLDLGMFGMPGCLTYLPPDASVFFVHLGGSHTYLTGFPNNQAFAGLALGTQAVMLDAAATNAVGATVTNLCAGRVGN
ncbi:MAG: hypothetical protein H6838_07750 [Planctomycetes bacterium]|nr:hypothetical protein [Planctomycetota bacterium]